MNNKILELSKTYLTDVWGSIKKLWKQKEQTPKEYFIQVFKSLIHIGFVGMFIWALIIIVIIFWVIGELGNQK